jgi:hypothetical protein
MRLLPNSLNSAVAVHENATPIEISSPTYFMTAKIRLKKLKLKPTTENNLLSLQIGYRRSTLLNRAKDC